MKNTDLFMRINYRAEGKDTETIRYDAHIKYNKQDSNKYMICGGIYNKNGGTIIFKAKDLKEAEEIANNNPLTKSVVHKYQEVKRDLCFLPQAIKDISEGKSLISTK